MPWSSDHGTASPRLRVALPASRPPHGAAGRPLPLRRRRRPPARWRQLAAGLALAAAGGTILAGLMLIPQRFDGLLLVSKAIADLIAGFSRLGFGLLQLAGVLVVALLAVLALVLLAGGLVRIVRALIGRPISRAAVAATTPPVARTTTGRRAGSAIATRRDDGAAGWSSAE